MDFDLAFSSRCDRSIDASFPPLVCSSWAFRHIRRVPILQYDPPAPISSPSGSPGALMRYSEIRSSIDKKTPFRAGIGISRA